MMPSAQSDGVPWNTYGISVYECSWLPGRWQFNVWHPNGLDMGAASSKEEAYEKAHAIARFHRAVPQGETP